MVQQTAFSAVKVPYVSGIELGVSIKSPSSASEDIATWLEEIGASVDQLDTIIFTDIVNKADARGLTNFQRTGEKVMTLTTVIRRELAVALAAIDALTPFLPDTLPEPVPPLRRSVAALRKGKAWNDLLAAHRAAEATGTTGMTDEQLDAVGKAASDALHALMTARAPDMNAVREKLRIMRATDTALYQEFFDNILEDVEALSGQEPA
ncbi:MAG: hypothetical protein DI555_14000 [Novosphingobium pentaromativorans]|uniref:Uncharacterized protein n=1 Tax=Novosphingobium pentaromativorans TaxID=205844 RepID=A0A2W5QRY5_9SPHN|nr:MAG: hypothetical protein DI555_14000 [Novosphingobium pentaromativorans]